MSMVELYLLTRLDEIRQLFWVAFLLAGACSVVAVVYTVALLDRYYVKEARTCRDTAILLAILFVASGFGLVFVPSEKDVAIIYAGHWATTNEEVTKLPENVGKFLNHYLEEVSNDD